MTAIATIEHTSRPDVGGVDISDDEAAARLAAREQAHRDLVARCRAYVDHLTPGAAFSHTTAAQLHRLPLSPAMEADTRLHVVRPLPHPQIRQPGVVGHRALHSRNIVMVDGLPVVDLPDTWADMGELIGRGKPVGLDDMIVLGDAIATRLGTTLPLRIAAERRIRPRGKRTLLEALVLIRVGSQSAAETITRLMFVRVGLPEPRLNVAIISRSAPRRLLGVADLVWEFIDPATARLVRVICEVQGEDYHSAPSQRRRDAKRRRGFEADNWLVEWVWADDRKGTDARRSTCLRLADALRVPRERLTLTACEPRFFAQHRLDEAAARSSAWNMHQR